MQSLNPFEIRASLKLNIINVIQGSEGLNPFEIRASLKPLAGKVVGKRAAIPS